MIVNPILNKKRLTNMTLKFHCKNGRPNASTTFLAFFIVKVLCSKSNSDTGSRFSWKDTNNITHDIIKKHPTMIEVVNALATLKMNPKNEIPSNIPNKFENATTLPTNPSCDLGTISGTSAVIAQT